MFGRKKRRKRKRKRKDSRTRRRALLCQLSGERMGERKGIEILFHLEWFAKSLTLGTSHGLRLATSLIGVSQ